MFESMHQTATFELLTAIPMQFQWEVRTVPFIIIIFCPPLQKKRTSASVFGNSSGLRSQFAPSKQLQANTNAASELAINLIVTPLPPTNTQYSGARQHKQSQRFLLRITF